MKALIEGVIIQACDGSRHTSRGAAADSSPQRELWVCGGNACEPRRGDRRLSSAPPELNHPDSPTPGSCPGLLSSAPPVLRRPAPSSITGRAKPPGEPPCGRLLNLKHLAGSPVSSATRPGRVRHSVRAAGSTGVLDPMGIRRRAEDCPTYLLLSSAGKYRTSIGTRARMTSERGLPGRSGQDRSEAVRRFLERTSPWTRCGPEGRAPKTPPDGAVPHPCHTRDPWAVFSIPFITSFPFVTSGG